MTNPGKTPDRSAARIVLTLVALVALWLGGAVHAQEAMRVEALDGGVVDLGGVARIVGTGQEIAIRAEGADSRVLLTSLDYLFNQRSGVATGLEAGAGGAIELNPGRTRLGANVALHLMPDGQLQAGTLELEPGATLTGQGTLSGHLDNGGLVSPGDGPGSAALVRVTGDYKQRANGRLVAELGGSAPGSGFDQLLVQGAVSIDGVLSVSKLGDFVPVAGSSFQVLAGASRTGAFGSATGLDWPGGGTLGLSYSDTAALLDALGLGFLDVTGPTIVEVTLDGVPLADGFTATRPGRIDLRATDPSAVGRVDMSTDGVQFASLVSTSDRYPADWDIAALADGPHALNIRAYDTYGNPTSVTYDLNIALAPPPSPTITRPGEGLATNDASLSIVGTATADSDSVTLFRNGSPVGDPIPVIAGVFSTNLVLPEGSSEIQAAASNRGGTGPLSSPITVLVDKGIPDAPIGLYAEARPGGAIRLSWNASRDAKVIGYAVYRLDAAFTDHAIAERIDGGGLAGTLLNDLPPADGDWFYRVAAINEVGSLSDASNQASAEADGVALVATLIEYAPTGPFDAADGRIGVGRLDITVHLSEEPKTTPFLSIAPQGGVARTVSLTRASETSYIGRFEVNPGTPSGTAYAVFSARDQAGNRGTEILAGATIELDTDGPVATGFRVTPVDPIRNDPDTPVEVQVRFGLSEPTGDGLAPTLTYRLSGAGRDDIGLPLSPDGAEWLASLLLPADAGETAAESLTFAFLARDDLGNTGNEIQGPNGLQVYQGELPPPRTPRGLTAQARPGGAVLLNWEMVEDAPDTQIYRAGPGPGAAVELVRSDGALEWTDRPGVDGLYRYSVASVRHANARESLSARSAEVEATADSVPPAAPTGLALGVLATGVDLDWQAAVDADPLTYRVYVLPGDGLGGLDGTEPLFSGIESTNARDPAPPAPEGSRITYLVTAMDPAGNESDLTAWDSINIDLLAVASLGVERLDDGFPRLSWTHANAIVGVDLYLGDGASGFKVNQAPLPGPDYEDLGWSGGERRYTVVARDHLGGESLPRGLTLPRLGAMRTADSHIRRGIMNRVTYEIVNDGAAPANGVTLELGLDGETHRSAPADIPAGASATVAAVVGGYAALPDLADLTVTLEQRPNPGELVRIGRHEQIEVNDGVLLVDLLTNDMTRGGVGQVRFAVENITEVTVQLVTATANGSADSDEIRILLEDEDGNRLGETGIRQDFGPTVSTIADGRSVATIAPGARFESDWLDLLIPAAAPEEVLVSLAIDRIHYRLGEADAIGLAGLGTSQTVALIETSYGGALIALTPEYSFGSAPVTIEGRALGREDGLPVPRVPLNLIVGNNGFERLFEMFTGGDGGFSFDYQPLSAESGTFRVSIVHPDLLERPEQGVFRVGRVFVEPTRQRLTFPRNSDEQVLLGLTAGREFPVTNARLAYLEGDQVFGAFEPGISVTTGDPIDLPAEGAGSLGLTLNAGDEARDGGPIILRLISDESPDSPLALVRLDYDLSAAGPALFSDPGYLELGAAPGGRAFGSVTLSNRGFAEVSGLGVELLLLATEAAPDWAFIGTETRIGALGIGEDWPIDLTIAPTDAVSEDIHELIIRVSADNHGSFDIPVYAYVTRSGIGGALFQVSDIFTATLDGNEQPIPGLAGARIQVQHEKIGTIRYEATTDALGEALFEGLAAGNYLFRASAADHADVSGRLNIKPGVTEAREVFLDYGLISLEWEVTEITIEDRYEIVLHLTYETDVPAPVVVIEPPGITLPEMAPGQVLQGEFTITNYGLIRADEVRFTPAPDDAYFDYEFMADIPASIEAKERITVPYRIVALRTLSPGIEEDTGGGHNACGYGSAARLRYAFICANGTLSGGGSGFGISSDVGADCGASGVPGSGCGAGGCRGYSGGGRGSSSIPCPPDCEGDCCDRYGSGGGGGGS